MKPFLRPSDRARLAPVGWVAENTGVWAGREVEVVFDPRRHEIAIVRNDPGDTTRAALASGGYRRLAVDGRQEMWLRDRTGAVEQSPERATAIEGSSTAKGAGTEGRGL